MIPVVAKWSSFALMAAGAVAACTAVNAPKSPDRPLPETQQGTMPPLPEPSAPNIQAPMSVTRLYNVNCANCHGEDGRGGGAGTKSLNTREKFDQKNDRPFFNAIKNGVTDMGMSSYGATLTDEEIWSLVVHIRELQSRALRAEFGDPKAENGIYSSQRASFRIEEVVTSGLNTPWGIDWLPDGRSLITNRAGGMHIIKDGVMGPAITNMPKTIEQGQGGLMDVAVHPNYKANGWIYLALADPAKNGQGALTKIVRGKLKYSGDTSAEWTDTQTIFEADQKYYTGAGIHFGSRIVFDGKGHIFFVVGERGSNMGAQSLETPYGKIMRVNEDGTIPSDNPFVGAAGAEKRTWSYGHRNPQGLVRDLDGNLWDTEHGPRGGDELNKIARGSNYGWPVVAFSINYNDTPFRMPWVKDGQQVQMSALRWLPSIAPSGLDVVRGAAFPAWKGDLLAGGLAGQNLDRVRIKDGQVIEREELLHGLGRIRDVATAPDGTIYVVLNEPHKLIRLIPAQ